MSSAASTAAFNLANSLVFRPYVAADIPDLATVINNAFHVDKFFKYPQYYDRTSEQELAEAMPLQESLSHTYLVGALPEGSAAGHTLSLPCAAVITHFFRFNVQYAGAEVKPITSSSITLDTFKNKGAAELFTDKPPVVGVNVEYHPAISTVSVHDDYQRRGIGKVLVPTCEDFSVKFIQQEEVKEAVRKAVRDVAACPISDITFSTRVVSHLEVLHAVRPGLDEFYMRQGYVTVGEQPFSGHFICLPEYTFNSSLMEKVLVE